VAGQDASVSALEPPDPRLGTHPPPGDRSRTPRRLRLSRL